MLTSCTRTRDLVLVLETLYSYSRFCTHSVCITRHHQHEVYYSFMFKPCSLSHIPTALNQLHCPMHKKLEYFVQTNRYLSCLQGFHNLTLVDPKWPLTSTKNKRLHACNVIHVHTNYEICPSFPSWDVMFTRFSQFDPCWPKWPLTSTKNNRLLARNVVHVHKNYEICPSFPSWDVMFTKFSQFDPCWPQMTFDLHQKQ